ncbi:MAG: cobalamin-dependent protein [archaeon]|nr:MAG: cobalamin-dependent protein [archaeon]
MKILLVNLKTGYFSGFPLSIAYISSYLKDKGYKNVVGVDLGVEPEEKLYKEISNTDVIGFSVMSKSFLGLKRIVKRIKEINPEIKIVAGGPHATLMPDDFFKNQLAEIVVIGEGEETMFELIQVFEGKMNLKDVKGIAYLEKGKMKVTKSRPWIQDLDSLPFPDRDIVDIEKYNQGIYQKMFGKLSIPILGSRSCPYNCANCMPALRKIAGTYRQRSPENLKEELKELIKRYGIRKFDFSDNEVSTDREWLSKVCDVMKELNITWTGGCRINTMDSEILKKMRESGCDLIFFGIESGSQRVLNEVIGKNFTLQKARDTVNEAQKLGIRTCCSFMICIPGEKKEEIDDTINFALSLNSEKVFMNIANSVPHTRFHFNFEKHNPGLDIYNYDFHGYRTENWDETYPEQVKKKIMKRFEKEGYIRYSRNWIDTTMVFYNLKKQGFLATVFREVAHFLKNRDMFHINNAIKRLVK